MVAIPRVDFKLPWVQEGLDALYVRNVVPIE